MAPAPCSRTLRVRSSAFHRAHVAHRSTENSFFVSNKRQAKITAARTNTLAALSLLVLPMAGGAVRVDTGYARGRDIRAGLLSETGSCARQSPAWFDDHASGRRRSAGGGRNGRGWRYAGRRRTLLRPSGVWSSMLSTELDRRSARITNADQGPVTVRHSDAVRRLNGARNENHVRELTGRRRQREAALLN